MLPHVEAYLWAIIFYELAWYVAVFCKSSKSTTQVNSILCALSF